MWVQQNYHNRNLSPNRICECSCPPLLPLLVHQCWCEGEFACMTETSTTFWDILCHQHPFPIVTKPTWTAFIGGYSILCTTDFDCSMEAVQEFECLRWMNKKIGHTNLNKMNKRNKNMWPNSWRSWTYLTSIFSKNSYKQKDKI